MAGMDRLERVCGGTTGPLTEAVVLMARSLFDDLHPAAGWPALIHGDSHPGNFLRSGDGSWRAIDPKGVIGDPLFDAANLATELPGVAPGDLKGATLRRVAILSEMMGVDRAVLSDWCVVRCVLSAWWSLDDHGEGWGPAMHAAELFAERRRR